MKNGVNIFKADVKMTRTTDILHLNALVFEFELLLYLKFDQEIYYIL